MSLWMVRGRKFGAEESLALEKSLACIGFSEVPDLSQASSKEQILELIRNSYPDEKEAAYRNYVSQLFSFAHRMKTGDLVAMPFRNRPQVALGQISGPYQYRTDLGDVHHTRPTKWMRTDIPRKSFAQDLLCSLDACMTVCQIQRNNAEERIRVLLEGKGDSAVMPTTIDASNENIESAVVEANLDIERYAHDQIIGYIESHFKGHELARLIDVILKAEGYTTHFSQPGPDGGVDILAGKGALGFDGLKLCVQVKSSQYPADVTVLRGLQGTMATFKADQGLLVSWGGFNNAVEREARLSFFSVRLWDADDLVDALLRNYERLPGDLKSELPLKRIWALVPEESDMV
jgi:restriction system protein